MHTEEPRQEKKETQHSTYLTATTSYRVSCYPDKILFYPHIKKCQALRLLFLPNVPGATFIQGGTSTPDSRVVLCMTSDTGGCLDIGHCLSYLSLYLKSDIMKNMVFGSKNNFEIMSDTKSFTF